MSDLLTNTHVGLRRFWHPVAEIADVERHALHRVTLLGEHYVLWRTDDGTRAFVDQCPHRAAQLSAGSLAAGVVQCAYHGWRFDQRGVCVHIPALGDGATLPPAARLQPAHTRDAYGLVWLAPDEPIADVIEVDEWHDERLRKVWLPVVSVRTSAAQFLDNFCDFAHFPFVHAGTFGAGEDARVGDVDLSRIEHGYRLVYEHVARNHEDPLVARGEHPLVQPRSMTYTYRVPFSALLRIEYPVAATVNAIATWVQPVDATTSRVYTCMLRNDIDDDAAVAEAVRYELAVLDEDIAMLERLATNGIALDLRAQVHTRADRCTVELRRCLAESLEEDA